MSQEIEELQHMIRKFCEERDWNQFHNPKDLAIGISTEANELLDLFRFKNDKQMSDMMNDQNKRKEISEELADVFYFLLRFADMNKFDLEQCFRDKMEKNNQKYPANVVKGKNLKYTEYEE